VKEIFAPRGRRGWCLGFQVTGMIHWEAKIKTQKIFRAFNNSSLKKKLLGHATTLAASPPPPKKSPKKDFFKTNMDQLFLHLEYDCFLEITDAEKMNTFLQDSKVPVIVGK